MSKIIEKTKANTGTNDKIFTRKFLRFISICSLIIIIYLICDAIAGNSEYWFSFGFLREPVFSLLGGFTIVDGIDIFSGKVSLHSFFRQLHILNSILIYFVLSPFLLFTGLREFFIDRENNRGIFKISKVKIYIGSILLINIIFNSSYMLYDVPIRQAKLVNDRSRDSERYRIQKNIQQLAVAGTQLYILESENLDKESRNIFIPEFRNFPHYEWLDKDKYKIIPINRNDSLLEIIGVGNIEGESKKYINANGDTGKVQVSDVIYTNGSFLYGRDDN